MFYKIIYLVVKLFQIELSYDWVWIINPQSLLFQKRNENSLSANVNQRHFVPDSGIEFDPYFWAGNSLRLGMTHCSKFWLFHFIRYNILYLHIHAFATILYIDYSSYLMSYSLHTLFFSPGSYFIELISLVLGSLFT